MSIQIQEHQTRFRSMMSKANVPGRLSTIPTTVCVVGSTYGKSPLVLEDLNDHMYRKDGYGGFVVSLFAFR